MTAETKDQESATSGAKTEVTPDTSAAGTVEGPAPEPAVQRVEMTIQGKTFALAHQGGGRVEIRIVGPGSCVAPIHLDADSDVAEKTLAMALVRADIPRGPSEAHDLETISKRALMPMILS